MKVEVFQTENEKVILDIMFLRANPKQRRHKGKKELIDTACIIFEDGREIACGIARQNPLDNYNKIVGRKVALAKAIAKVGFLKPFLIYTQRRREMRRQVWKVFHQTFGRWN